MVEVATGEGIRFSYKLVCVRRNAISLIKTKVANYLRPR